MPNLWLVQALGGMKYMLRLGAWPEPETHPEGDLTNPELYDCLRAWAQQIPEAWSRLFGRVIQANPGVSF